MPSKYLSIYLNDHLAGATAGVELARRAQRSNAGTPLGDVLERLADEIDADRDTLIEIMDRLGAGRDRVKVYGAWAAEKVGRLKPNGHLKTRSPLSTMIELEGLHLGVTGKIELWRALRHTVGNQLSGVDFDALIKRGESQRRRVEQQRLKAAEQVMA